MAIWIIGSVVYALIGAAVFGGMLASADKRDAYKISMPTSFLIMAIWPMMIAMFIGAFVSYIFVGDHCKHDRRDES